MVLINVARWRFRCKSRDPNFTSFSSWLDWCEVVGCVLAQRAVQGGGICLQKSPWFVQSIIHKISYLYNSDIVIDSLCCSSNVHVKYLCPVFFPIGIVVSGHFKAVCTAAVELTIDPHVFLCSDALARLWLALRFLWYIFDNVSLFRFYKKYTETNINNGILD